MRTTVAKSPPLNPFVRMLVNEARRLQLSYSQFNEYAKQARKHLAARPPPAPGGCGEHRLLSEASLARFYEAIDTTHDVKHQIMLRLLFDTALRVSKLCRIEIADGIRRKFSFRSHSRVAMDQSHRCSDERWILRGLLASVPGREDLR